MDKNRFHDEIPKVLDMAKKLLFTCDPFNNIQQALVFSVLNMQANQYKKFECRINFLFPRPSPKDMSLNCCDLI